ncbi:MAG: hypothetical protein AAB639_00780, partial [Patescibacteria group bacterium]
LKRRLSRLLGSKEFWRGFQFWVESLGNFFYLQKPDILAASSNKEVVMVDSYQNFQTPNSKLQI